MPIRHEVDSGLRIVSSRASGVLLPEEFAAHVRALSEDARILDGFSEILDLRDVVECRMQVPDLVRVVDHALERPVRLRRSAIVCQNPVMLAKMQLYRDFTKPLSFEVGVFNQPVSAAAWLDLGPLQLESVALAERGEG